MLNGGFWGKDETERPEGEKDTDERREIREGPAARGIR